jgi:tetratricopeptide (TPR) repeat protein
MHQNRFPIKVWSKPSFNLGLIVALSSVLTLSGCQQDVVHQRSMAELNQKAQTMMQAGDYEGAVSRLEAAHDLQPDEPNTTFNLAIAYQTKGDYQKAVALFNQLLQKPGPDDSPMSKPEIQKALGITTEAQADKLEASAKTLEDDPKGDKSKAQMIAHEADLALQQALMHYREALPGLKNPEPIKAQIQAIETKLKKAEASSDPSQSTNPSAE